jgi:acylphosphatase
MSDRMARRLRIHGRVQGVWFRESMSRVAGRLGVTGWVRNRLDGTVEAALEGPREAVETLVRWAHRGPEAAEVSRVEVCEDPGGHIGFAKRPTE